MKRLSKLFAQLLILTVLLQSTPIQATDYESIDSTAGEAIIYNLITGEVIDTITVSSISKQKDGIEITFNTKEIGQIKAPYWGQSERDGIACEVYYAKDVSETVKIFSTGQVFSGSYTKEQVALADELGKSFDSFGFIILSEMDGIKHSASITDLFIEIVSDKEIALALSENKTKVKALLDSNSTVSTKSTNAHVHCVSGSNVAEGTAYYYYTGTGEYFITSCEYITTNAFYDPADEAYVKIYGDINGSALWRSSVNNQITTECINILVDAGGTAALTAHTAYMGVKWIKGVPVPYVFQDWDQDLF